MLRESRELRAYMLVVGCVAAALKLALDLFPVLTGEPLCRIPHLIARALL